MTPEERAEYRDIEKELWDSISAKTYFSNVQKHMAATILGGIATGLGSHALGLEHDTLNALIPEYVHHIPAVLQHIVDVGAAVAAFYTLNFIGRESMLYQYH